MLNRAALIVRPKQPFLDWAAGLDDSGLVPDVDGEKTVYLIPEFESDEEGLRVLKRVYAEIFERDSMVGTPTRRLGRRNGTSRPFSNGSVSSCTQLLKISWPTS